MIVDVGIATSKVQSPLWWSSLLNELLHIQQRDIVQIGQIYTMGSALMDHNRSQIADLFIRPALTSENRNAVVDLSMATDADAIAWVDDDTIPPPGFVERLLTHDADIAAGVYYRRSTPYDPLVYKRQPSGLYSTVSDIRYGELRDDVDAVGFGCTVVHRRVYERILDQYRLFYRADHKTSIAIHKDDLVDLADLPAVVGEHANKVLVTNDGIYRMQELTALDILPDHWPFYTMEHGRTEDMAFCEMALRTGSTLLVDAAVEAGHVGEYVVTGDDFRAFRRQFLAEREAERGE